MIRSSDEWEAREKELVRIADERNETIAALMERLKEKEREIKRLRRDLRDELEMEGLGSWL